MFTHPYAGSQLARERSAKCWHNRASSAWCARPASSHGNPALTAAGRRITRLLKRTRPATLPS